MSLIYSWWAKQKHWNDLYRLWPELFWNEWKLHLRKSSLWRYWAFWNLRISCHDNSMEIAASKSPSLLRIGWAFKIWDQQDRSIELWRQRSELPADLGSIYFYAGIIDVFLSLCASFLDVYSRNFFLLSIILPNDMLSYSIAVFLRNSVFELSNCFGDLVGFSLASWLNTLF